MPTIEVRIWDLERIARTSINYAELDGLLSKLKCEVEEVRGDVLIYEASHDRPDLFSAEGLGRAIRNLKGIERGFKELELVDTSIEVLAEGPPNYRPYVLGAVVRGLRLDDEAIRQLFQLQEKLHVGYCGDRSLVAIGIHDLRAIDPPIYYKAVSEYVFKPLGYDIEMSIKDVLQVVDKGVKYRHLVREGAYPLLVDSKGMVLSLPPIINGDYTKITPDTRDVFIDITGTEPELMSRILNVVIGSLIERSDNPVVGKVRVVGSRSSYSPNYYAKEFKLSVNNVKSLTGIELGVDDIVNCLSVMGFNAFQLGDEVVLVKVPPYRIDVMHEVDLIEDILIGFGYEHIETELLPATHPGGQHPIERFSRIVRDVLVGLGIQEVVNFMMVDSQYLNDLGFKDFVALENPKMKAYSAIRNSLIPSILQSISLNSKFSKELKIFEVGDVVEVRGGAVDSVRKLCVGISTPKTTLTDSLIVLKSLMYTLNIKYTLDRCYEELMIPSRCAKVIVGGKEVGIAGEVHPRILNYISYTQPVAVLELNLTELLNTIKESR